MPISAIQTGVVDDVLPPEAIAGKWSNSLNSSGALQLEPEKQEVLNGRKDDQSPRNLP